MFFLSFFQILVVNSVFVNAERWKRSPILGAHIAQQNEGSYAVAIINSKNEFVCTGGIIGERYIVSAAHCFVDKTGKQFKKTDFRVVAGTNDLSAFLQNQKEHPNTVLIAVEEIVIPKDFERNTHVSDIAILKLIKDLKISEYRLRKLKLPKDKCVSTEPGRIGHVSGFGYCEVKLSQNGDAQMVKGTTVDGKLRHAFLEIVEKAECHGKVYGKSRIGKYHFLGKLLRTGNHMHGMCYADSGSPLVDTNKTVIGVMVNSFDKACNGRFLPSIFIEVPQFIIFINNVIAGHYTKKMCVMNLVNKNSTACTFV